MEVDTDELEEAKEDDEDDKIAEDDELVSAIGLRLLYMVSSEEPPHYFL